MLDCRNRKRFIRKWGRYLILVLVALFALFYMSADMDYDITDSFDTVSSSAKTLSLSSITDMVGDLTSMHV